MNGASTQDVNALRAASDHQPAMSGTKLSFTRRRLLLHLA